MSCLELLIRLAFEVFSRTSKSSTKISVTTSDQQKLRELLGKCSAADVNLHESMAMRTINEGKRPPVTYIDVFDHPLFTIGIFVIHRNAKIPLHDHPGMFGFIKVLSGEMKLTSYTKVKSLNPFQVTAHEEQSLLNSSSPAAVLTPNERNYHQLEYVKGENDQQDYAAFLDILSPPYNSSNEKPECNYYIPIKSAATAEKDGPNGVKSLMELRKCPCPRGFYNDIAPYLGPDLRRLCELK